jgi:hypothetical protein
MLPLEKSLRNQLERTVKEARAVAERAASAALEQLCVNRTSPDSQLTGSQKTLRNKLRAHGRQLGDSLNGDKSQTMDRLVEETAYQHWHRMLFARFLAENDLLMYPDPENPVPVTLEECDDLAPDENAANGWELAARFAARMLPQVFRVDSPVFSVALSPEHQRHLERLVAGLPSAVFRASDSLGWVYQFWQAKRKDDVNASEVKIGARELPAVTQLFTEPYMVSFLLDNGLGAWWAARTLVESDLANAPDEETLRQKASRPGIPLDFLRFVRNESGTWAPAGGTFDQWPENLADLKIIDPCCGSGHFLVAVLLMLVPMRMAREGLTAAEAVDAVLSQNLHGLELDPRCVEIAAFALALTAWKLAGYRPLPRLNVACSGLAPNCSEEQWLELARAAGLDTRTRGYEAILDGLRNLHSLFAKAPTLGSLIDPQNNARADLITADFETLQPYLAKILKAEAADDDVYERAVAAEGMAKAAELLSGTYHWVVTNVPYLSGGKQEEALKRFCENYSPEGKSDLANVFLIRCLDFCDKGGTASVVLPQNWLFLTSYRKFREKLLNQDTWNLIARLGPGAFETISGEVVKAILISLSRGQQDGSGSWRYAHSIKESRPITLRGLDVTEQRSSLEKAKSLCMVDIKSVDQAQQTDNPDARIALDNVSYDNYLGDYASSIQGLATADDSRFKALFWERRAVDSGWVLLQGAVNEIVDFAGRCDILFWENGEGQYFEHAMSLKKEKRLGGWKSGHEAWSRKGISISEMQSMPCTLYTGEMYDHCAHVIIPANEAYYDAIWSFCSSSEFRENVRKINQKLNVTNATLVKVPFDLDHWQKVAEEKYPNGLPKPYTDDPTQWIFHGHPCGSVVWDETTKWTAEGPPRHDDTVLQVAVARLLGYRWPAELDPAMELADEQRSWVNRCAELLPLADKDGIVCIPPVRGEPAAADRLLNLLAAVYGPAWTNETLAQLLTAADHAGKTLETWLREKFFTQHCKLFGHRPFVWHIWDGLRDGFSALVNYHKLDAKLMETLIYTYLGDWIARQKQDIANGVDGAQERLAAAERLKKSLEAIREGEAPYDIFVRWKPLAEQPMGWNPDLNDGVRLNIRPFLTVPDVGKKGAGILRDKPNVNWNKDRGKDVPSAPWYHQFQGERINDHHITLAEKRAARGL